MKSKPSYFEILGVGLDASPEEIRRAYLNKARQYHPDAVRSGGARHVRLSDDRMKAINLAYEVLRDAEKRRAYQRSLNGSNAAPEPVVEGVGLHVSNATPGVSYTGYLIVRNLGGPYSKLKVTPGAGWIKVTSLKQLTVGSQLPIRVEIEMCADAWDTTYREGLAVSLDGTSTTATVALQTRPMQRKSTMYAGPGPRGSADEVERLENDVSHISPSPRKGSSPFGRSANQGPDRFVHTQSGKLIGAASSGILGLTATAWVALQGADALSRWPTLAVTLGILGGVYMGFVVIPIAIAVGFALGWLAGFGVWAVRKLMDDFP